jgi:hypothetical protein
LKRNEGFSKVDEGELDEAAGNRSSKKTLPSTEIARVRQPDGDDTNTNHQSSRSERHGKKGSKAENVEHFPAKQWAN